MRCGYKSTVKLLFIPPNRGVGTEASAHTTVVDVVEEDVVVDAQVELAGAVVSTADAGAIRYGPKNRSAIATTIETKRIFFMNMTIAKSMKGDVCTDSSLIWPTVASRNRPLTKSYLMAAKPNARSAKMSSIDSRPTDKRIRPGVTPADACSSGVN